MAYEYESRLKNRLLDLEFDTWEETAQFEREYRELQEVYRKAKAWNKIHEMTTDKAIRSKIFDDEMYKLLHQTDKSDAKIIIEIIQLFLDRLERADDER